LRIDNHLKRGRSVRFLFDGREIDAFEGETVAAALLAIGQRQLRRTNRRGEPRGLFCGIGACFDCLVQVDGKPNMQACLTPVRDGMVVETQLGLGSRN